jgi:hypothetical protein
MCYFGSNVCESVSKYFMVFVLCIERLGGVYGKDFEILF